MSTRPELKFSDNSDERSFYKKFQNLPPLTTANTLRIVDKGDYYTVLGEQDTQFVAELIYKTTSVIKSHTNVPYLTLSPSNLSSLIQQTVFDKGYKLEIYDKNINLIKRASPGNIEQIDDLIQSSENNLSNSLIALKITDTTSNGKKIGYCSIDTSSKIFKINEFIDNDLYSNLESLLIQIDAKEVLIPSPSSVDDPDYVKLLSVIDRSGCVVTELKPGDFNNKDIEQDLTRLIDNELLLTIGDLSNSLGLNATSAILKYLQLLSNDSNFNQFKIENHSLNQFMKLDSSALKALNLFPQDKSHSANGSKNSNLYDLLNNCKSSGGSRLLHQWLKQPLIDIDEILQRQNLVEILINDTQLRSTLFDDLLISIPDLKKLNKNLHKRNSLEDVVRIYQFLIKIPDFLEVFQLKFDELDDEDLKSLIEKEWISPINELQTPLLKLQELVETTVDLESLDNHQFIIKPDYDEVLLSYKQRLDVLEDEIKSIHQSIADDLNLDSEKKLKLEFHQVHGWCLRLTRNEEKFIRGDKQFIELQTVKAGVYFTTNELKSINEESLQLKTKYSKQQSTLVNEIISITSTYSPILEKISLVFAKIDVLTSFAHISSYAPIPYTKPKLHPINSLNSRTILKNARHPCVELQNEVSFIPNDIELIRDESEFLIITGPNMGGKSTYIRQLGVISLMAQIGCFLPVDTDSEISIFDAILSRIGAGDSQLKGVSTFMMEMLEMSSILKIASRNSLIIIDELGRGTSTYDGFGLAWAISEHISQKIKCFTMFATHFHELTKLNTQVETVKNLHVVAHVEKNEGQDDVGDDGNITLLYKVEPGISDQSFGINVAEVVKFPQKIISMAKRKAIELEEDFTQVKKVKPSNDEVVESYQILIKLLKNWKKANDGLTKPNDEIINELKELITNDSQIATNEYIKQMLEL